MTPDPTSHPAFATPELRVATTIVALLTIALAATFLALIATGIVNFISPARYDNEPLQQRQQAS